MSKYSLVVAHNELSCGTEFSNHLNIYRMYGKISESVSVLSTKTITRV